MVIFIDEIDVLLGSRGSFNQSDFKDTKIAEFLTAWDGFHKTGSSTIVIGATNRKEILDDAILRRLPIKLGFDRKFEIANRFRIYIGKMGSSLSILFHAIKVYGP